MKTAVQSNLSDEQLVIEFLNGNNDSMGTLYGRYYSKVYYKCLSYSKNRDDAFDMAQDVLMKTFSNVSTFKGDSKFSTWLFSITHNHCISYAVKAKKEFAEDISKYNLLLIPDFHGDEYEDRYKMEEIESRLDEYLQHLPACDRKLLEMKYRQNYSVKDLQKEFKLSASAVKMRLLRARQKFDRILNTQEAA